MSISIFLDGPRPSSRVRSISHRKRQGVALVVVLAALAIIAGVLLPLIPPALRARRQVDIEEVALQNEFLKSAVTQRLTMTAPSETVSDEELSKLAGQVRFGPNDALQGEWFVRRKDSTGNSSRELEVTVRIEFKESSTSGVSPWMIPKSESVFSFPFENQDKPQQ
jgi:hypothetical protein